MNKRAVMTGVDLSHWNVVKDWDVLSGEVDFVMLKIGGEEKEAGTFRVDPKFLEYYKKAKEVGLHLGGYFFAGNKQEIIRGGTGSVKKMVYEVHNFLRDNHVYFDMPLALDFENQNPSDAFYNTMYVQDWCNAAQELNYYVTIYASDRAGFKEQLILTDLVAYDKWVARYNERGPLWVEKYGMWQSTSTGELRGVDGNVDIDFSYFNYPDIISKKALNI